jgi:hypothetical protein
MANTATQFGFKHLGYLGGGAPDYQLTTRAIQSTYSTVIGFGDVVVKATATSQYVIQGTGTTTITTPVVGIFQGCTYRPAGQSQQWSPSWVGAAAADATAYIIDAPSATFLCAVSSAALATGNIGQCAAFTTNGLTATTVGAGLSVMTLDSGTIGTAGGTAASFLPFRILQMYQGVGNGSDPTSNFNWVVVGFNFQQNRALNV